MTVHLRSNISYICRRRAVVCWLLICFIFIRLTNEVHHETLTNECIFSNHQVHIMSETWMMSNKTLTCFSVAKATLESQISDCPFAIKTPQHINSYKQPSWLLAIIPINHHYYQPSYISTLKTFQLSCHLKVFSVSFTTFKLFCLFYDKKFAEKRFMIYDIA